MRIIDKYRQYVVVGRQTGCQLVGGVVIAVVVRHQNDQVVVQCDIGGTTQCIIERMGFGRPARRGQSTVHPHEFMANTQHVGATAMWLDFHHFVVPEDHRADAVSGIQCSPGTQGGEFGCGRCFRGPCTTEEHRRALIDDEEYGALAFFGIDADVRFAQASGCPPVDRANVVAGAVVAQLFKCQAAPPQSRCVSPAQQAMHRLAWQERKAACLELQTDEGVECGMN